MASPHPYRTPPGTAPVVPEASAEGTPAGNPFATPPGGGLNPALAGLKTGLNTAGSIAGSPLDLSGAPPAPTVPGRITPPAGTIPAGAPLTPGTEYKPGPIAPATAAPKAVKFSGPSDMGHTGARVNPFGMVAAPNVSRTFTGRVAPSSQVGLGAALRNTMPTAAGFDDQIARASDATYRRAHARLAPGMELARKRTAQRLADQGIPVGSEAYNAEMNRLDQQQADAMERLALSSDAAGRQEHSRLTGLASALRGQEWRERAGDRAHLASEEGRLFRERLGSAGFDASEEGRGYRERLSRAGFESGERGRDFNERLASERQLHAQRLAEAQFRAQQAARRDAQDIDQRRHAAEFTEDTRRHDDTAGRRDREFGATHSEGQRRHDAGFNEDRRRHDAGLSEAMRRYDSDFGLRQNAQLYGQGRQARSDAISEALLRRRLPFEETERLLGMGGSLLDMTRVGQPNFYGGPRVNHGANVWNAYNARRDQANDPRWWDHALSAGGNILGGMLPF